MRATVTYLITYKNIYNILNALTHLNFSAIIQTIAGYRKSKKWRLCK